MPRAVFEQLSAAGQRCCRNIVSDEPVSTTWAPDWEGTQGGGSVDNQLHKGEVVDDPWNTGGIIFGISFMYALIVYEFDEKLTTFFKKMFDKPN